MRTFRHSAGFAVLLLVSLALTGCGYDVLVTRAGQPVPNARIYIPSSDPGQGPFITNDQGISHIPLLTQPIAISAVAPNGQSQSISAVAGSGPYHIDLSFDAPHPAPHPASHAGTHPLSAPAHSAPPHLP